ncbi:MAG: flagellar basal body-associated protein FliL [Sulfurimonas sp.]|jgi:flagellar FliL protein|nr:flagellar basal body-associated protein FliL [Sulfurimonas sp.]MBU1217448.1 flagellar basal body-associated protein FliL [bacterium]MBU1433714.1 flagellar basal body-associated protein FliL [bacterium]MBU1503789.1 flagellar basal body-associated protein FliL [bacterium]MBU3939165.1 flagellar basal body-associated protein FliL [bacterium]
MAEKEKSEQESAPAEKKSGNMLMIIIIVVLVLIILIGAIVGMLLMGGDEEQAPESAPQVKEKAAPKTSTRSSSSDDEDNTRALSDIGILYPVDTFTVNLKSDAGRRYLKVTLSLELEGKELSLELDSKSPVIRDRIIRILTSKTLEEISSKKGKQKIENQIMDTLNAMITDGKIKGIYFTEFVIQ